VIRNGCMMVWSDVPMATMTTHLHTMLYYLSLTPPPYYYEHNHRRHGELPVVVAVMVGGI